MKKFLTVLFLSVLTCGAFAAEGFRCGVWMDYPDGISKANVNGLVLGAPIANVQNVAGPELTFFAALADRADGFQFALFGMTKAKILNGVQLSMLNFARKNSGEDFALQIGCYNQSAKEGIQLGTINYGQDNATFQLGLININKNGWLPVMILVNFGKDTFK